MMLSILSGSLIDVLVPSFVSSSGADRKGISRLSSCVSASFWIGLFIYLFLRKVLAGVAKRFLKSLAPTTGHDRADGTRRGVLQRKIKKTDPAKESAEIRDKSEETMDATSPRCCALLTLTAVEHRRAARHKLALQVVSAFKTQNCFCPPRLRFPLQ